ncbi:hypothetical protein CKAH01_10437 [Colletotrichum kahawae]|uniref:Uncharacterized protein n=1 Tax=Colletotrichum kahawae TaxID=34407 RepID=A0AAD9XVW6_COLKA|nr:hypothetical protein CKAH01_10437 [Colletotrichum kahawae]
MQVLRRAIRCEDKAVRFSKGTSLEFAESTHQKLLKVAQPRPSDDQEVVGTWELQQQLAVCALPTLVGRSPQESNGQFEARQDGGPTNRVPRPLTGGGKAAAVDDYRVVLPSAAIHDPSVSGTDVVM